MDNYWHRAYLTLVFVTILASGCGTTRDKQATNQLLLSDAVDRAVARIDFSPLRGERVYLDTTYVEQVKGANFVNADYIISSLRQQMALAGCLLQEDRSEAEFVAEARVGALGTDAHDVNFGVSGTQGIGAAASLVTNQIPVSLPEVSLARRTDDSAASKIAVFAYHRETRQPVWQSGLSVARSSAESKWILGAGPIQSGTIYEGTRFAGGRLRPSPLKDGGEEESLAREDNLYRNPAVWSQNLREKLFDRYPQQIARREQRNDGQRDTQDQTDSTASERSDRATDSSPEKAGVQVSR